MSHLDDAKTVMEVEQWPGPTPRDHIVSQAFLEAAQRLARRVLEEGDETPVTYGWMRSHGCYYTGQCGNYECAIVLPTQYQSIRFGFESEERPLSYVLLDDRKRRIEFDIEIGTTRGDVRRLCAALGITLKETANG